MDASVRLSPLSLSLLSSTLTHFFSLTPADHPHCYNNTIQPDYTQNRQRILHPSNRLQTHGRRLGLDRELQSVLDAIVDGDEGGTGVGGKRGGKRRKVSAGGGGRGKKRARSESEEGSDEEDEEEE